VAEGITQGGGADGLIWKDDGQTGAEEAIEAAGQEQRHPQAGVRDLVTVGARDAPNETPEAETAEIVGDRAGSGASAA
jgi:hypothetical protein